MTRALVLSCLAFIPLACTAQTPTTASPAAPVEQPVAGETAPAPEPIPHVAVPSPAAPQKITYTACNVDGKYIAMTYDDGPHATLTPRLLDMLKERGIKATFFVVGKNVAEYPKIAKRIVDEGHEIASHSWSHPLLSKMSDASVRDQLERTHAAIEKATGVKTTILRPPYGGFTERQRRWAHGEFGYKTILWDLDPLDWKVRNANHVEREILKGTRSGSIILTHDIHKSTVDAMPGTLDALLARGFK
ncbi:MAG: polysaccharide deacetylase family protein, partial [Chthoniobacteraceae bacterium]